MKAMQVTGGSSLRLTASKSEPVIASLECGAFTSSQELWAADSPPGCQTSGSTHDCTIDWDTFESDLKVGGRGIRSPSNGVLQVAGAGR